MATETGNPKIKELIEFLKGKIDDDDIATVVHMINGGDPADMGQDEPEYKGRDVPLTGGGKALDSRHRRLVNDGYWRNQQKIQLAHDQHRDGLGLRPIRNLG